MEQAIKDYAVKNGAMGIVMDVNTGAILAMATLPDYDLNHFSTLNQEDLAKIDALNLEGEEYEKAVSDALFRQWKNRTISDTYEPGSTFKIFTLSAALEDGIVDESSTFTCNGSMDVIGRTEPLKCCRTAGHGIQTLAQAAQHSCNVAFVTIGLRLGAERFYDYVRAFGFMDETGVDMGGEGDPIWWPDQTFKNPNDQSSLAAASFGQTFNITPLQLITAVSAVANGGYLMEPYIVRQILGENGEVIRSVEPTVVRQVISEDTSARVCAILESVVADQEGTGKNAYVDGYRIAGKTGTSENVGQGTDEYIVSFVGFAPADDPKIAILVLLDSPGAEDIYVSGGRMAAPVVGNIFADVLPYIGVEAVYEDGEVERTDVLLPNVKNLSVEEAKSTLQSLGFQVQTEGSGETVMDQIPMANVTLASGSTILLYTESEKPADTILVPALLNLSYRDARNTLEELGLYIRYTPAFHLLNRIRSSFSVRISKKARRSALDRS
jgi:stage V sporulation protein D (sporulation-specific penicillin-binding protein)